MDESSPAELTPSAYGLLAFLSEGPTSGYQIKKTMDTPEMAYWRESNGQIYPILKTLTRLGLAKRTESNVKRRRRSLYELTEAGRRELENWLRAEALLNPFRVEMLLKLRFGYQVGAAAISEVLQEYERLQERELAEYRILQQSQDEDDMPALCRRLTLDFWVKTKEGILEWCRESLKKLRGIEDHIGES